MYFRCAINVGFHVLSEIRSTLLGFNVNNLSDQTDDRHLALHSAAYMLSESVRLDNARDDISTYIMLKKRGVLKNPLVNVWSNNCNVAFKYELFQQQRILKSAETKYKLNLTPEGAEDCQLSMLVGPNGILRVLLYDGAMVQALIEKREKDNPPGQGIILKNLVRQKHPPVV